jgi:hypothetical protein
MWRLRGHSSELEFLADSYAVGRSIVSHYAYGPQRDGLSKTDILQRYRLLALEETGFVLDYA